MPDLFYARHLRKQNFVLWYSPTEKPDLGGKTKKCNVIVNKYSNGMLRHSFAVFFLVLPLLSFMVKFVLFISFFLALQRKLAGPRPQAKGWQ